MAYFLTDISKATPNKDIFEYLYQLHFSTCISYI